VINAVRFIDRIVVGHGGGSSGYHGAVKLRDLPRAFGFGLAPREFGHAVVSVPLARFGDVQFARWLHPGETPKTISDTELAQLSTFLQPGDVAIDIGAHTGDSTLPIALVVGSAGRVFALEPNPYVFRVLAVNASLNPTLTRITPWMFAAMPKDGDVEFSYSDNGYCNGGFHRTPRWSHGHFARLRVTGRNLASWLQREAPEEAARVRYIKVDTEGFDRPVVTSLADLIRTAHPCIRSEIHKSMPGHDRAAFFRELQSLGYRLLKWDQDDYRSEELTEAGMTRWKHFDLFAEPRAGRQA
jgi:FkbM family methyltransferase